MVRLPVQAQIMRSMREDPSAAADCVWGERMRARLRAELPPPAAASSAAAASSSPALYAHWLGNTAYCYRLVEGAMLECMRELQTRAARRGSLAASSLRAHERQLVELVREGEDRWQEVVLLTQAGAAGTEGVVLNRPLAKRLAAEKGVDLSSVSGSGPNGRIVKADLDGAKPGGAPAPKAEAPAAAPSAPAAAAREWRGRE
jgi:pyruvate/2-oxoglutarate dehydrogenase complex dihydrolipoamide acyltransferase (E2) component